MHTPSITGPRIELIGMAERAAAASDDDMEAAIL